MPFCRFLSAICKDLSAETLIAWYRSLVPSDYWRSALLLKGLPLSSVLSFHQIWKHLWTVGITCRVLYAQKRYFSDWTGYCICIQRQPCHAKRGDQQIPSVYLWHAGAHMVRSDLAKSVQGRSQDSDHLPDTLAMHVAGHITIAVCVLMNNSGMRQHGC
jgi:hypothetical protein